MNTLVELASQAEGQPYPPGAGPYSYVHTRGWYLATDQLTDGRVLDSRVEETAREFWVAPDGSGRIEETRDGRPSPMSGVYEPGGLWPGPLATVRAEAPAHAALRQSRSPLIEQIGTVWRTQTVPPALQADLLRALAAEPGVRLEEATDRAGRLGIAVSSLDRTSSGGRGRHVLVLDPETGMVLATEDITLGSVGPGRPPGVSSYTYWVRTGFAPDPDTRP
jgi:hypothetical protein